MSTEKAPTIRDVAAAAGVSTASVSLAYHQPHRLRPATREAILSAAQRLDYQPHLAASLLRSRHVAANSQTRKITIAFVTAEQTLKTQRGKTVGQRAAQERAEALGYGFERVDLALQPPARNLVEILRARGVAGVIFGPNYKPQSLEGYDWHRFAGVCLAGYPAPEGFHRVRSDPFQQATLAWEGLRARGYRRIGAVMYHHEPWLDDDRQRVGAVLAAQQCDEKDARIPVLLGSPVRPEVFGRWFKHYRPEAVIDFLGHIDPQVKALGFRIPEDCALVALSQPPGAPGASAEVRENQDELGTVAVGLMDQLLRHHEIGAQRRPLDIRISPQWIDGASVLDRALSGPSLREGRAAGRRAHRGQSRKGSVD